VDAGAPRSVRGDVGLEFLMKNIGSLHEVVHLFLYSMCSDLRPQS
jgi:hypothetical protein